MPPLVGGEETGGKKCQSAERAPLGKLLPRFWDLIVPFKRGDYVHPGQRGSASIKQVLPVLVPSLSYKNLNIPDGGLAAILAWEWFTGKMERKVWDQTRQDLLEYCGLDTLAMVEILRELKKITSL